MRELIVKYEGNCKKCGNVLEIGIPAMYEKSMGIFCIGCEPKEVEEIREYRTIKAEAKAERYDEWAGKREQKARAALNSFPSMRHDWAFITQPGRIPFRDRMNKSDERAMESLKVAEGMRDKAESLSHVRVVGDAARKQQAEREAADAIFKVGDTVYSYIVGECTIVKINKKTYTVRSGKTGNTFTQDKSYIKRSVSC